LESLAFLMPSYFPEKLLAIILYVGELDGTISERILNIEKIFVDSGITVDISENIDAWLKTHMALIAPLAMASYTAQKQNKRFGEVEELIKLSLVAFRENMKALKKLGIPILPKKFKVLGWIPKFIIIKKLRDLLNSDFGRIALSGHADSAHDEMKRLVEDFRELVKDVRTNLDANSTLYKLSFA
jgi:2-dehydropantoate 2-reductase